MIFFGGGGGVELKNVTTWHCSDFLGQKVSHYCQPTPEGFGRRLFPARYCGWLFYFPGKVKFHKK